MLFISGKARPEILTAGEESRYQRLVHVKIWDNGRWTGWPSVLVCLPVNCRGSHWLDGIVGPESCRKRVDWLQRSHK